MSEKGDIMVSCPMTVCNYQHRQCHKLEDLLSHSFRCNNMKLVAEMNESKLNSCKSKCSRAENALDGSCQKVIDAEEQIANNEREINEMTEKIEKTRRFNNEVVELEDSNLTYSTLPKMVRDSDEKCEILNGGSIVTILMKFIKENNYAEFYRTLMNNKPHLTISMIKELLVHAIQENDRQIIAYLLIKYNKELSEADYRYLVRKALQLSKDKPTEIDLAIPVLLKFDPGLVSLCLNTEIHSAIPVLLKYNPGLLALCLNTALVNYNLSLFKYLMNYNEDIDLDDFDISKYEGLKGEDKKIVMKLMKDKKKIQGDGGGGFLKKLGL